MVSAKSITEQSSRPAAAALQKRAETQINLSPPERLLSTVGGGAMVLSGLRSRGMPRALLAVMGGSLLARGITGHSSLYQALHINRAEHPFSSTNISSLAGGEGFRVTRTLTIHRMPEDLYAFWRDFANAPLFMPMVQAVDKIDEKRSHWIAGGPTGQRLEWDVEIMADQPGRLITWQVRGNKAMIVDGSRVSFTEAPRQRGTMVTLEVDFVRHKGLQSMLEVPLLGKVSATLLELRVLETLRHFKALMETGEVPTLAGQPTGWDGEKGA